MIQKKKANTQPDHNWDELGRSYMANFFSCETLDRVTNLNAPFASSTSEAISELV